MLRPYLLPTSLTNFIPQLFSLSLLSLSSGEEEDEDTEEDEVMEMEGIPLEDQVDSVFRPPIFEGGSQGESTASESTSMPKYFRSISGVVDELPNSSK